MSRYFVFSTPNKIPYSTYHRYFSFIFFSSSQVLIIFYCSYSLIILSFFCPCHHIDKGFFDYISDVSGSYQTLTKRVETCVLDNSVIGTSKGGLSNVRMDFLFHFHFEQGHRYLIFYLI